MSATMRDPRRSDPVRDLETVRPAPAKAGLRPSESVGLSDSLGLVAKDAVVKHYGSVKAAAITLQVDPSLLMRELEAGKLARLDADPDAKTAVSKALFDAFGCSDPKSQARQLIRDVRARLDALGELL